MDISHFEINENEMSSDLKAIDLGGRDIKCIKIAHKFKFDIQCVINLKSKHLIFNEECISIDPFESNRILFAFKECIYLFEIIGCNVEIIKQYTFKYNAIQISHKNNNIICVSVKLFKKILFISIYVFMCFFI